MFHIFYIYIYKVKEVNEAHMTKGHHLTRKGECIYIDNKDLRLGFSPGFA